jgi:hypothetical protein
MQRNGHKLDDAQMQETAAYLLSNNTSIDEIEYFFNHTERYLQRQNKPSDVNDIRGYAFALKYLVLELRKNDNPFLKRKHKDGRGFLFHAANVGYFQNRNCNINGLMFHLDNARFYTCLFRKS